MIGVNRTCLTAPSLTHRGGILNKVHVCSTFFFNGWMDKLYICDQDYCNDECHLVHYTQTHNQNIDDNGGDWGSFISAGYVNGPTAASAGFTLLVPLLAWLL